MQARYAAITAFAVVVTGPLVAQDYPAKPVRIINPYAAGGGMDFLIRPIAQKMGESMKGTFVIDNRAGANGMIAAEAIAKSPADGYSVLYCTTGNMTIITELPGTNLAVNPATQLMGLSQMLRSTFGLVVGKDSPWKSTKDIIDAARAREAARKALAEPPRNWR